MATADALLSAWFGCAMGETWTAALETPPHTWAEPNLARCHAVGRVVDAPAARLRAFVPDAVSAVSRSLEGKLGVGSGYSMEERRDALELFSRGTRALEELSVALDSAQELTRERASMARIVGNETSHLEAKPPDARSLRSRFVRISRAEGLFALWSFGNGGAGMRSAEATALAWMSVLQRVHNARKLPPDLRVAYVSLALETVAKVNRPDDWKGDTTPKEAWDAYLARAVRQMGGASPVNDEREAHAALKRAIAERLRASAHPLSATELRRAALGCAEAFLRDGYRDSESD